MRVNLFIVRPTHGKRTGSMARIEPYLLNLAGEYRVCSELNKRGVFATVTYGNRKGVDVYAISDRRERAIRIEVKTSQRTNFVTRITQKRLTRDPTAPDFWVLFQIQPRRDGSFGERFFVLTHREICRIQAKRNRKYAARYMAKHRKRPDPLVGVDNVKVADVTQHEDQWAKIIGRFKKKADPR